MDNFKQFFDKELTCIDVIHEFLAHYEFTSTMPVFIEESKLLGFPVTVDCCENSVSSCSDNSFNENASVNTDVVNASSKPHPHIRRDDITKIISSFESKDYKLFFELWQKLIPSSIKESNLYRELTFYLYVYFATLPYRQKEEDDNKENNKVDTNDLTTENKDNEDKENLEEKIIEEEERSDEINIPVNNNNTNSEIQDKKEDDNKNNVTGNNKNHDNLSKKEKLNENLTIVDIDTIEKIKFKRIDEIDSNNKSSIELINVEKNEFIKNNNVDCFINSNNSNKVIEKDNKNEKFYENFKEELNRKIKIMNINKNEDYELNKIKNTRKKSDDFDADSLNTSILEEETNQNSEEDSDGSESKAKENDDDSIIENVVNKPLLKGNESEKDVNEEEDDNVDVNIRAKNSLNIDEQDESAMDVLKTFLTTKGPEFSSEPDFLPYFALPFIHNPQNHPSFMDIFKESWAVNMERRLIDFIKQYSYGNTVTPTLMRLQSMTTFENTKEINTNQRLPTPQRTTRSQSTTPIKVITSPQLQESMIDSNRRYKNMKWKFQKLHRDHQNLIGVAAELTNALENSVRGQAVDLKATLNNCVKIFPELFSRSRFSTAEDNSKREMRISCQSDEIPCYHLDVQKIKQHLATGSIKAKLLLLQALRWRLTRSTGDERDQIVTWITQHDVLSLRYGGRCPVLEEMLITPGTCTPHPLQQAVARLLNTIASLRCGRDYLAPSHNLLTLLVTTLKQDNIRIDQTTADMLLACLQKLSLRRNQRLWMIEEGVVAWLIDSMKMQMPSDEDHQTNSVTIASAYTLEYSTALLMNLCLHEEARERFPPLLISVLIRLLDTTHTQILPVVAGTLYCLLTRDDINEVAKELQFENTVTEMTQKFSNDPSLVRQLETLLRLHKRQINIETLQTVSDDQNEDEMDDPEELEQELDLNDHVRAMPGDLAGDDLLNRLYSCPTSVHGTTATSEGAASMMSL